MTIESVKFKSYASFSKEWAGLDQFKPVSLVVGRNNTGKSRLIDLVEMLCSERPFYKSGKFLIKATLNEPNLRTVFSDNVSHGDLEGNHWIAHGRHLIGGTAEWETESGKVVLTRAFDSSGKEEKNERRINRISGLLSSLPSPYQGLAFRHLSADRNISPEPASGELGLRPDGTGATNIVRQYLTNSNFPHEIIESDLLNALNQIFGSDGQFNRVTIKTHGQTEPDSGWEILLGEKNKGLISLSKSGSGLKTILLVLLHLLVMPKMPARKSSGGSIYAFEELENNLHPSLLRRLLQFIVHHTRTQGNPLVITTHSPIAIDMISRIDDAQIIQVHHDGETARTTRISGLFDKHGALADLGTRASDVLHANGIIWVEGPSDRVYLNRWLELASHGEIEEGKHYQCAFYGGALLGRVAFSDQKEEEDAQAEFVNLLRLNPNFVVVCDSDRTSQKDALKPRVQSLIDAIAELKLGWTWVTCGKEIENYLPGTAIAAALSTTTAPSPSQWQLFFPSKRGKSYIEQHLNRKSIDKISLATSVSPHLTLESLESRFDWKSKIDQLMGKIQSWNR